MSGAGSHDQEPREGHHDPHDGEGSGGGSGLVEFSTRRRVTVAMFWLTMFLFGVLALMNLKVAALLLATAPPLIIFLIFRRQIQSGLVEGALKA